MASKPPSAIKIVPNQILYVKPFIRWIWLGTIFMALGGLLAILDRRYRVAARQKAIETLPTNVESLAIEGRA